MSLKQRLGFAKEPLYLMDGTAFVYRGFFANPGLTRTDGMPTGALAITGRVLLRLLREERPERFAFIMDGRGPHFRHEIFPAYKANRPPTPEGLIAQIEPVRRMARAFGLHVEVSEACEADDCIASLAARYSAERPVVIVGMDKDLRQCLRDNVVLWDPSGKEERLVTLESFRAETGLEPSQWPDVQALVGDSSDNVPGVRGVGPKTAEALFRSFRSLEDIRDRVDETPPAVRKKLDGNLEAMFLYRRLTTLSTDCCAHISDADLRVRPPVAAEAQTLLREYEMRSLERDFARLLQSLPARPDEGREAENALSGALSGAPSGVKAGAQFSLFAPPARPAPEEGGLPAAPRIASVSGLPPITGASALALTPAPGRGEGMALALQTPDGVQEWLYDGPMAGLAARIAGAGLVVAPDVKKLLCAEPAWSALPPDRFLDLGLAAYLLAPEERDYSWPRLSARHAAQSGLDPERPATLALSLAEDLRAKLDAAALTDLMRRLELPLIPVLAAMEREGVRADLAALRDFLDDVQRDLDALTARIYEAAGGPFNIRSAQQIGEVLFKRLDLPAAKATKGGQASTSQDVLERLSGRHPVIDALLEFRKLEKLRSTYLEPLPRLAGPDGRVRTTFNQTSTATGRLSSSNPNLQNIPVRGPLGKRMRACFTAAPGNALISADYSQVELRVLAHYSQDPTLLEAFRHGEDIHARTAALLHDVAPGAVTPDQRRAAKTINFGLLYGMGARKLAQELSISQAEAKAFIEKYFAGFSRIKDLYEGIEREARERGYVVTMAGRRRPLPDMVSASAQARALAERQAVNTVIQGSAADIIKLAMIAVHHDAELKRLSARLILQIHDELLLEAPEANAEAAGRRLAELMDSPPGIRLDIPLAVDWGFGRNWGEAH